MMDLYCVLCGGKLIHEGEGLVCSECDARYESVLLSETKIEKKGRAITELSLSMDFLVVEETEEAPLLQEVSCIQAAEAVS
jgi:hypothetical protein